MPRLCNLFSCLRLCVAGRASTLAVPSLAVYVCDPYLSSVQSVLLCGIRNSSAVDESMTAVMELALVLVLALVIQQLVGKSLLDAVFVPFSIMSRYYRTQQLAIVSLTQRQIDAIPVPSTCSVCTTPMKSHSFNAYCFVPVDSIAFLQRHQSAFVTTATSVGNSEPLCIQFGTGANNVLLMKHSIERCFNWPFSFSAANFARS